MENKLPTQKRPPTIIETEHLLLRTPRIEDALELHHLAAIDRSFANATVGQNSSSLESACTAIVRMLGEHHAGTGEWWIVTEKDSGKVVGLTGFSSRDAEQGPMSALATQVLGRGYAREVVEAIILCSSPKPYLNDSFRSERATNEQDNAHTPPTRWYWHAKPSRAARGSKLRCA